LKPPDTSGLVWGIKIGFRSAISIANLTAAQTAFENVMTGMAQGGTQATTTKNKARNTLVALLRQEAQYVQLNGNNDLPTLRPSGFQVNSTNKTQTPLEKPGIVQITNEMNTQLVVQAQGVSYAVQIRAVGGSTGYSDWSDVVSHMAMQAAVAHPTAGARNCSG
jgi:hypothetical protein